MKIVSLAIDSVDSLHGGCTTHFSTILLETLRDFIELIDLPLIVRLNPGIPWKTRGNAAVVLRFYYDGSISKLLEHVYSMALEYSNRKDLGIAVIEGRPEGSKLRDLYLKALTRVVPLDVAISILEASGGLWAGGRGLIGAISALSALTREDDYTFELIAYRKPENWGVNRCIDTRILIEIESTLPPITLNNIDYTIVEETVAPKGLDPVLAGFRGNCLKSLVKYAKTICEPQDIWAFFRTNQHTDAHAIPLTGELRPYNTGVIEVKVKENPIYIAGGHVIVEGESREGGVDLAFYRETGPLNEVARLLTKGDEVRALGTVKPYKPRHNPVLAVEKIWILRIAEKSIEVNPRCPICGERMESLGRDKGFRCRNCGYKSRDLKKISIRIDRRIKPGEYTVQEGRLKHLTKPRWRKKQAKIFKQIKIKVDQVINHKNPPNTHSIDIEC
ncbi:MAG: tRNA(Ile)(2)-agmatinylcytidine synthase [Acidilobaceae archaeon]